MMGYTVLRGVMFASRSNPNDMSDSVETSPAKKEERKEDGWIDRWIDRWMDGWMEGPID